MRLIIKNAKLKETGSYLLITSINTHNLAIKLYSTQKILITYRYILISLRYEFIFSRDALLTGNF